MFQKERQDLIAGLVKDHGRVTVSELARHFDVTEDCIRKDLKQLDGRGLVERVYGGAIAPSTTPERNVFRRMSVNAAQKGAIARKAYDLVRDGETIYLDISTTNVALAHLLAEGRKRCIVMSNMVEVLQTLATNSALTAICVGGNVNLELNGYVGSLTVATLEPMRFDRAFVGALGVELDEDAVTTFDVDDGLVKQRVIRNSAKRYLVVEAQKFGAAGSYRYGRASDFDAVITDKATPNVAEKLGSLGVACL